MIVMMLKVNSDVYFRFITTHQRALLIIVPVGLQVILLNRRFIRLWKLFTQFAILQKIREKFLAMFTFLYHCSRYFPPCCGTTS